MKTPGPRAPRRGERRVGMRRTREVEYPEEKRARDPEGSGSGSRMTQQKTSYRKGSGVEGRGPAPIILSNLFGEDEDVMEIDSPASKETFRGKNKNQSKGPVHGKRTREFTKGTPSQTAPAEESTSVHLTKFKF